PFSGTANSSFRAILPARSSIGLLPMTPTGKIFRARVLTALADDSLFFLPDARLELSPQGRILKLDSWEAGGDVTELSDEHGLMTLIPPFCDVHFHWVQ